MNMKLLKMIDHLILLRTVIRYATEANVCPSSKFVNRKLAAASQNVILL